MGFCCGLKMPHDSRLACCFPLPLVLVVVPAGRQTARSGQLTWKAHATMPQDVVVNVNPGCPVWIDMPAVTVTPPAEQRTCCPACCARQQMCSNPCHPPQAALPDVTLLLERTWEITRPVAGAWALLRHCLDFLPCQELCHFSS